MHPPDLGPLLHPDHPLLLASASQTKREAGPGRAPPAPRRGGSLPGTGKSHLAIAVGIRACLAGQRVAFATATAWVARLGDAKRQANLETELRRLGFVPLIIVDVDPEAANLMFSLASARYERASLIVTGGSPGIRAEAAGPVEMPRLS